MAKLNNKEGKILLILLINQNEEKISRFITKQRNLNKLKNNKKFINYVKKIC